ncbi:succinate dehydrogenase assembly factor 2 [Sphingomonas solaris]|uniref:FAD assembly factor SdhE n=1 Tax=Alterirhizorhabdus solaris TaxID=2529389 RepID=A0A558QZG2_9SPHN|nr:succinate dehydrogenase assembly factor 2 [Sphingomonas solaris]TVV72534.1 succinate dehydrogenase assembly factor 2 [Sphingomonas solaris]
MDRATRLKRLKFRAWHRGTKEADYMMGGYYDTHAAGWTDAELDWFEALIEEQDVDIMGWAIGTIAVPDRWQGPMMARLQLLDYIQVPR